MKTGLITLDKFVPENLQVLVHTKDQEPALISLNSTCWEFFKRGKVNDILKDDTLVAMVKRYGTPIKAIAQIGQRIPVGELEVKVGRYIYNRISGNHYANTLVLAKK